MKKSIIPANVIFYLGLVSFAVGITAVTVPEFTIQTIIIIIGIIFALGGAITMILRLRKKSEKKFVNVLQLILSGINVVFGAILAIIPDVFLEIFIIILGAALIMGGITQLIITLSFTPISNTGKMFIGLSLVMIISGTIFIFNPFETATAITKFFGIIASIYGLTNIMLSFWLKNEIAKANKPVVTKIINYPAESNESASDSAGDGE